jgi:hypothetical protein
MFSQERRAEVMKHRLPRTLKRFFLERFIERVIRRSAAQGMNNSGIAYGVESSSQPTELTRGETKLPCPLTGSQ